MKTSRKKPPSAKHLTPDDYGEHCQIETREPPADFQQQLIDRGAMPASVAVLWRKERVRRGMKQGVLF